MKYANVYLVYCHYDKKWEIVAGVNQRTLRDAEDGTLPDTTDFRYHLGIFPHECRRCFKQELEEINELTTEYVNRES